MSSIIATGCRCSKVYMSCFGAKKQWKKLNVRGMFSLSRSLYTWNATIQHHVEDMHHEYQTLSEKLLQPQELSSTEMKKCTSELSRMEPAMRIYNKLLEKRKELLELAALAVSDLDLEKLAEEETAQIRSEIQQLESGLIDLLIPVDSDDESNAVLEIRAGTGGREASLFAAEVFGMYTKYAGSRRWRYEVLSKNESDEGGINKVMASISGNSVFASMKHESGVHRVQRVPQTESSGRLHTSTISVAVLPQPEDVNVVLDMRDVKVDTFKSSGAGGQHVNTTDSAVRLTHIPTGIVVANQDSRSQSSNKSKAMQVLAALIYDKERIRAMEERRKERKIQIGSSLRSERIRTYNFTQDRVTDHRINITLHGVANFLNAGENFQEMIEELKKHEKLLSLDNLADMKPSIRV